MGRAERRLEIARGLLKLPQEVDVLAHINKLDAKERSHLRELVDWVEDYENCELSESK